MSTGDLKTEFDQELVEAAKFKIRLASSLAAIAAQSTPVAGLLIALIDQHPEVMDPPGMRKLQPLVDLIRQHMTPATIKLAHECLFTNQYPWTGK